MLPSTSKHLNAHEAGMFPVSRIAFTSCMKPFDDEDYTADFWKHVRYQFKPDLFIWLGDNAYADGKDMDKKRKRYNEVRDDGYYKAYGPIGSPLIPVTGIWE